MKQTPERTESSDLCRKIDTISMIGTQRQKVLAIVRKLEWLATVLGSAASMLEPARDCLLPKSRPKASMGKSNAPRPKAS